MRTIQSQWFVNQTSFYAAAILWITLLTTVQYYIRQYIQPFDFDLLETKILSYSNNEPLVDLHDFEFKMNNESLCMNSVKDNNSFIVILVHSARDHFDERYAIRNTWGSLKVYKEWRLHLIFLLGVGNGIYPELEDRLLQESKQHGDMVMGNFVDSHQNLTYKHIMGYKWMTTFCPTAKYILKTNDDVYADLFQVIEIILVELSNTQNTFACLNMIGNGPIREPMSKWYVSEEQYSDEKYPEYCSGVAYLMKANDAAKIYSVSNKVKFFALDDIFVTGILRKDYGVLINDSNATSLTILSINSQYNYDKSWNIYNWCNMGMESNQLNFTFVVLNRNEIIRNMFCMWNKVKLMRFAMQISSTIIERY